MTTRNALITSSRMQHFEMRQHYVCNNASEPHRLDFYLVFILTKGEGVHTFGLHEHYIKENMLCFVAPEMITAWHANTETLEGFFCTFSEDFINEGRINKHFLNDLPFFQIEGNTAVLHLTHEQTSYYLSLLGLMQQEYTNRNAYSSEVLRNQLQSLLYKAHAQYYSEEGSAKMPAHPGLRLTKAFIASYMRDFKVIGQGRVIRFKKVADYAEELGVSQNHLNDTIKAITGKSAGQHINNQLIKQATICLKHSSKSIAEIAYALGYEDPSYFARYYKKHTGFSPSDFRQRKVVPILNELSSFNPSVAGTENFPN